jgi:hypothetical protein
MSFQERLDKLLRSCRIYLTLCLLTGYKMYPGLEFSWTFLAGTEKQCYQFLCLFIAVPLTQHNHHLAHLLFFTCGMFSQTQLDHFVPMLVKNVSNTCSARTYYINHLTHKNCKRVTTSNPTTQLTDELAHFCSHVILAPIAGVVNYVFLSSNILSISLYVIEWLLFWLQLSL